MKQIGITSYQQILASATVLERDAYGEKVLALPDGNLVKIFRRKRWFSSALFFPYARRFVRNARRLSVLQIATLTVLDLCQCRAVNRHLVTYRPLPGDTLRNRLRGNPAERPNLLIKLAGFIAQIHQKGVYFRSVHFGNIIVLPDGRELGLIDVADMAIKRRPLSVAERLRNFRHMLRYPEDTDFLKEYGWKLFVAQYMDSASSSAPVYQKLHDDLLELPEFSSAFHNHAGVQNESS